MTVLDLIREALEEIGVTSTDSPDVANADATLALHRLNDLASSWQLYGLFLPEFVAYTDTIDLEGIYIRALRLHLAVELAPAFGMEAGVTLAFNAKEALSLLLSGNPSEVPVSQVDNGLLASGGGRYNIYTDT